MESYDQYAKQAESPSVPGYGAVNNQLGQIPTRRRTAWDALRNLVEAAKLRSNQLEALQRALPQELPLAADEALIRLFDRERQLIQTGVYFGS